MSMDVFAEFPPECNAYEPTDPLCFEAIFLEECVAEGRANPASLVGRNFTMAYSNLNIR